jgi:hypothetical protein
MEAEEMGEGGRLRVPEIWTSDSIDTCDAHLIMCSGTPSPSFRTHWMVCVVSRIRRKMRVGDVLR